MATQAEKMTIHTLCIEKYYRNVIMNKYKLIQDMVDYQTESENTHTRVKRGKLSISVDNFTGSVEDAVYKSCKKAGMNNHYAWWVTKSIMLFL